MATAGPITRYQGPNVVYQHGVAHLEGQESTRLVHACIMFSGGIPFGRPVSYGVGSLSQADLRIFKQLRGYHTFDSYERVRAGLLGNKFTLQGAQSFDGDYKKSAS